MKIIQLEYFCAVSRYHSITQATQKLFVTQPAISTAIKESQKVSTQALIESFKKISEEKIPTPIKKMFFSFISNLECSFRL